MLSMPNIPENDILVFPAYDNAGKLIGIGALITSTEVSRQTGFSQELSSYIKDGRIKFVWVDGRRYFFQKDVDRELKVPEGWWNEETTVKYTSRHRDHLRRLRMEGNIVGKTVHKVPYYEPNSVEEYFGPPEGTFIREEANDFLGVSNKRTLQRLVDGGIVSVQEKRGINSYSQADLRAYKNVPDGYISVRQASRKFSYSESKIPSIAAKSAIPIIKRGNASYILEAGMEEVKQREDLEEVVNGLFDEEALNHSSTEEIAIAIARRLGIHSNGNYAPSAKGGSNQYNGKGVTLNSILEIVRSFE